MNRRHVRAAGRREEVARLLLQGQSQHTIAPLVGVSQQQVSKDLKVIHAQWQASMLQSTSALKAAQLARIRHLEREAWAAWERSKARQCGDPRYLTAIQGCWKREADLLGLDAPQVYQFDISTLSESQLLRMAHGESPHLVLAEATAPAPSMRNAASGLAEA